MKKPPCGGFSVVLDARLDLGQSLRSDGQAASTACSCTWHQSMSAASVVFATASSDCSAAFASSAAQLLAHLGGVDLARRQGTVGQDDDLLARRLPRCRRPAGRSAGSRRPFRSGCAPRRRQAPTPAARGPAKSPSRPRRPARPPYTRRRNTASPQASRCRHTSPAITLPFFCISSYAAYTSSMAPL